LGGGEGRRLFPLTKTRCKPAVPVGGKYRLVDVALSNCIHSGYNRIYLLTQYHTRSLHRHIRDTYHFDSFAGGFVEVLSAELVCGRSPAWYEGTADAVRKNLDYLQLKEDDLVLILAGDHLYRMDFAPMVAAHLRSGAEVTVSAKLVPAHRICQFGAIEVDENLRIVRFVEKPDNPEEVHRLQVHPDIAHRFGLPPSPSTPNCLASMGNYIFRFGALRSALAGTDNDFGKNVLPGLVAQQIPVGAYLFDGYWEDLGTIRSFFDANIALTDILPPFDFFDAERPIFTTPRYLPASKVNGCSMEQVVMADGCLIDRAILRRCMVGTCAVIRQGSLLENVLMMGNDFFEKRHGPDGTIPCGIGRNCHIRNAIVDKNVRIGDRVRISPEGKPNGYTNGECVVVDAIACVPNGATLPNDFIF
jgi:glucose-1-phosphate adenylyltransferase